jgi:hypothetical protein
MSNLYSVLGVSPEASGQSIKAAYRELAKLTHPDLHLGDEQAESRTKEINYAYTILSDPETRAAYDQELALQAARKRRVFFVNASAISAGMAAFAVTAAALMLTISLTWQHLGDQQLLSKLTWQTAPAQIGNTIGETPESAVAIASAASEPRQAAAIPDGPAQEIASAKTAAPEIPLRAAPAEAPMRAAATAPAASGSPRLTASSGLSGITPPGLPGTAPATRLNSVSTSLLALATGMPKWETPPEHASVIQALRPETDTAPPAAGAKQATAAATAVQSAGAVRERADFHRDHAAIRKASRKSGERAKAVENASFFPPRLQAEPESAPWSGSSRTTALRWPSGDGPFEGIR